MIVADTNLIIYLFLKTEQTPAAERVFGRDPDWRAPPLWMNEMRNALVLYVRRSLLTLEKALSAIDEARGTVVDAETGIGSEAVMRMALERGLSAYDAEFVVLAEALGVPLVTADRGVLAACPDLAVSPEVFASAS